MSIRNLTGLGVFLSTTLFFVLLTNVLEKPLPKPVPSSAGVDRFSSERAMGNVTYLSKGLGLRLATSENGKAAADYLFKTLSDIPGIEVERQVHSDILTQWGTPNAYTDVENILAKIPGEIEEALLISAHYDTPHESMGASDDAASVATMLEVITNLQSQKPYYTLIFNFNGAEEQGLMGAHAFVAHPWFTSVKSFINLEAAGNKGKQLLFRTGPQSGHLVAAFSQVPFVSGNVIGEELIVLLGITDTDFRRYVNDDTVPGLDLALANGGYVYHTMKDTVEELDPSVLQAQGDNLLALTKALAFSPWKEVPGKRVYFDMFGRVMVDFDLDTTRHVGLACCLALLVLVFLIARRNHLVSGVMAGFAQIPVAAISGIFLTAVFSAAFNMFEPMSWFAAPWKGYLLYGGTTLLALSLVHKLWHDRQVRKSAENLFLRTFLGQALALALMTGLLALTGSGSVYLLLSWSMCALIALVVLWARPDVDLRVLFGIQILVPGLLTMAFWKMLFAMIVPSFGYFGNYLPIDTIFAVLVSIASFSLCYAFFPFAHGALEWKAGIKLSLALVVMGAVSNFVSFPYSETAPKRLTLIHDTEASGGRLLVRGEDTFPIDALVSGLENGTPSDGGMSYATKGSDFPFPVVSVLSDKINPKGQRELSLRITAPGAYLMDGHLEGKLQWVNTEGRYDLDGKDFHYRHVGNGTNGWPLELAFDPQQALPQLRFEAYFETVSEPVREFQDTLPKWVTVSLYEKTIQQYMPPAVPDDIQRPPED